MFLKEVQGWMVALLCMTAVCVTSSSRCELGFLFGLEGVGDGARARETLYCEKRFYLVCGKKRTGLLRVEFSRFVDNIGVFDIIGPRE